MLLRFGTQVNNQGLGPASLISGRPGVDPIPTGAPITSWGNPDGSQNVLQAVYEHNPNGSNSFVLSHYRAGGRFTYHPGHGHFHYDGYANYSLRHNVGGQPGAYVQRPDGTGVVGAKTGFCLINISSSFTMTNGQSSTTLQTYSWPGQPSTGCGLLQGVSVGRADVYSSSLEGQWLDVTGVPNGQYFLEISMDGENAVQESDETNNAKSFAVTLNVNPPGGGITPDQFDTAPANNNTFDNAFDKGSMGVESVTGLTVHWGQDYDYFKFTAASSGNYTLTTTAASGNIDLYLYDANRNQIAASTGPSGSETITYNFVKDTTYFAMAHAYNSTVSSNYQIRWNILPTVSYSAPDPKANEHGPDLGNFRVDRNGPVTSPLLVNFAIGGTATRDVDYTLSSPDGFITGNTLSIGDLASSARIVVNPISDRIREGIESVTLNIASSSSFVSAGGTFTILLDDSFIALPPVRPIDGGGSGGGGGGGGAGRSFGGLGTPLFNGLTPIKADDDQLSSLDELALV